jgi:hypothetical protein
MPSTSSSISVPVMVGRVCVPQNQKAVDTVICTNELK